MINQNAYPYFDDFDPAKDFHKVLFHPAKPVQARELSQMQSILQEQIKRHGDHVFKNGTIVIPGHLFYDANVMFLKLESIHNQTNIESYLEQLVGKQIKGDTNGISALVIHYDVKTATDPTTVYIKYTSGAGSIKEFASSETLTCPEIAGLTFKVFAATTCTGKASICTINDGVFYINGYFVGVAKQSVTLSKYSNSMSAIVGLDYIESVVTENEDASLYDNAYGFTNFGAPGAHRLKISLNLNVKPYDYTMANTTEIKFIDLLKIKNGKIEYLKNDTQYAEIEKLLARRTYDESGDYSVVPFKFKAYNYRNNDIGQWTTNTPYLKGDIVSNAGHNYIALNQGYSGSTAPTQTFAIQSDGVIYWNELPNKTKFLNGGFTSITSTVMDDHVTAERNLIIETSAGKAYVKGFEVDFTSTSSTIVPKARATAQLTQAQIYAPAGSYVIVNNVLGIPNVDTNLTKISLLNVAGSVIGTAWVRSLEFSLGDLAAPTLVEYRMFLFNVNMNAGFNFSSNVHTVSSTVFSASIKPTLKAISGSASSTGTTVNGVGTYFDFELRVGDRVKVGSTWTTVQSITSPVVFIATSSPAAAAGSSLFTGASDITKLGDYIRELSSTAINTLRAANGAIDMQYVVSKQYSITTVGTSYTITLTNGETFLPSDHIVIKNTGTLATSVPVAATYALDTPATTLTIGNLVGSTNYSVLVLVKRTAAFAKEKSKTIATKTITLNNTGTQLFSSKNISLTEADCIRLIKVTSSGDSVDKVNYVSTGEEDITSDFTFDNGQRSEFYDVGRIKTIESCSRPIRITFEYFIHSSGDYFSVDSYSSVPRAMINNATVNGHVYYLPDCLDFRSRIADSGLDFNSAGGASISDPLLSEMTMSTSYSYFLPRQDTFGIDTSGELTYNIGGVFKGGMQLCTVDISAYTTTPSRDVKFHDDQITNYTMKDLKVLDSRLANVEYYVALSELEKATVNTSIKDEFGLERDKNGFLVDEFNDHDTADTINPDYKASVDFAASECRAFASTDGVNLIEPVGVTDSSRSANGYMLTGNQITLPYTEVPMLSQTVASRAETIQAYATMDFIGHLKSYPEADNYINEVYDSVTTQSHAQNAYVSKSTSSIVYGAVTYSSGGHDDCGIFGCHWVTDTWANAPHYSYSTSVSSNAASATKKTQDYVTNDTTRAPLLRARTVVLSTQKLKPFTSMNLFFSNVGVNRYFMPCTVVQISTTGKFIGGESNVMNDLQWQRSTNNFNSQRYGFLSHVSSWFGNWGFSGYNLNPIYTNSYDTIQRGEVITCSSGSGVVVSDETIYDKVTGTNKRVLYVINTKGTLAGTITGATSHSTATVMAVSAGSNMSNSLGNLYGAIVLPSNTFKSGNNKILLSDATDSNTNNATTLADSGFFSEGVVNTHTQHLNYESQTTITTTTNTNTNVAYY